MAISSRVLTLLQFTRAALVFTAIADTGCALVLRAAQKAQTNGASVWAHINPLEVITAILASCCLYGFGMALNDLVDRRRDALLAATRPLPSGRLGVTTAHLIVTMLAVGAMLFGGIYAVLIQSAGSFLLLLVTLLLISFYNFAGKYLVSAGLLTLGLIRGCHALIAAPEVPVVWHPLWLFTHVVVVSAVAYVWEEKRPRFSPVHSAVIYGGLVLVNVGAVAAVITMRCPPSMTLAQAANAIALGSWVLMPAGASVLFAVLAWRIGKAVGPGRTTQVVGASATGPAEGGEVGLALRARRRQAGQRLMLFGLLWLIFYDAIIAWNRGGTMYGAVLLTLLPIAYASVRVVRIWAAFVKVTRSPNYRQATTL